MDRWCPTLHRWWHERSKIICSGKKIRLPGGMTIYGLSDLRHARCERERKQQVHRRESAKTVDNDGHGKAKNTETFRSRLQNGWPEIDQDCDSARGRRQQTTRKTCKEADWCGYSEAVQLATNSEKNHYILNESNGPWVRRFANLSSGYNYDSASIRRPFDCLWKVIKVTVT